jgi:PAS domain S-box-containing protein
MNIIAFQERYGLRNKDIAKICGCSLPTIQKWRSGNVAVSGAAAQLLEVLERSARGDPVRLKELINKPGGAAGVLAVQQGAEQTPLVKRGRPSKRTSMPVDLLLDKRRLEKALFESESRYLSVMEAAADPICRWRKDTTLTYANPAYRRLFAKHGEDLIGRRWIEFVPYEDRQEVMMIVTDLVRRGEHDRSDHIAIGADGRTIHYQWMDWPVKDERGEVVEFHSIGHDRSVEKRLQQRNDELETLYHRLLMTKPTPAALLGKGAAVVQANPAFTDAFGVPTGQRSLFRLLGNSNLRQVRQLLQRLTDGQTLQYRFEQDGKSWRMLFIRLSPALQNDSVLVEFEPVSGASGRYHGTWARKGERPQWLSARAFNKLESHLTKLVAQLDVSRVALYRVPQSSGPITLPVYWEGADSAGGQPLLQEVEVSDCSWLLKWLDSNGHVRAEGVDHMPKLAWFETDLMRDRSVKAFAGTVLRLPKDDRLLICFEIDAFGRVWHAQDVELLDALSADLQPLIK